MKLEKAPKTFGKQKAILQSLGFDFDEFIVKSQEEKAEILHSLQKEYLGTDKPVNHIKPLVSVCTITYRHAAYIREYFEGVLMQQTDFPFEIVVCDDGSDDGTAEICREYAEKYPDKIRLYDRIRPLGVVCGADMTYIKRYNLDWCLEDARGKYIALCEGDDYWTDPLKLQKQVDFLEAHPDYSMCFHNAIVHYENSDKEDEIFYNLEKRDYDASEIQLNWMVVPTASIMIRKEVLVSNLYKKTLKARFNSGDLTMCLCATTLGKVYCISDIMSVYRRHESGMSYTIEANRLEFIKDRLKYTMFGGQIAKDAKKIVADCYKLFILDTLKDGKKADAIKLMFSMLWDVPSEFFKTWGGYLAYKIKK